MFASLVLAVIAIAGLFVWAWLWWCTRGKLPRQRRGRVVVEGESRDVTRSQRIARDASQNE